MSDPDLSESGGPSGWVNYARPFEDEQARELVLEIGGECTKIDLQNMRVEFHGDGRTRISKLFDIIATKLKVPPVSLPSGTTHPASPGNTPLSEDLIKVVLDGHTHVILDGEKYRGSFGRTESEDSDKEPPRKRKRSLVANREEWIVKTGQWRLQVRNAPTFRGGVECVLVAVKLDAFSGQLGRNIQQDFLAG
jgi:hypothetical protein